MVLSFRCGTERGGTLSDSFNIQTMNPRTGTKWRVKFENENPPKKSLHQKIRKFDKNSKLAIHTLLYEVPKNDMGGI